MQAIWNGVVIASSDDIVTVEGNAYFPQEALDPTCVQPSEHRSVCGWKGEAHYYNVVVKGAVNPNAAWFTRTQRRRPSRSRDGWPSGRECRWAEALR